MRRASKGTGLVVLWGCPTHERYRMLFRELDISSLRRPLVIEHRHHGFREGTEPQTSVAELIEAAALLGARRAALTWFVAHGERGLLPPRILARELGVDPEAFLAVHLSAGPGELVRRDLETSKRLELPRVPVVVVVDGRVLPLPRGVEAILAIGGGTAT